MMRRPALATIVLLCAALVGCGGKGGDGGGSVITPPPPPTPTFRCSDSPPEENQVVLRCGGIPAADVGQIDVMIGPSTSTDIGGFAFELLFDPTILSYVSGSAQSGTLLFQGGTALLGVKIDPVDPGRLVVGIYLTEGTGGVEVKPGTYDRIMTFAMKVMPGAQFDPDPKHLVFDKDKSQALDASDPPQWIQSITFNDQLLLSNQ
jgi:hypothetical protein